MYITKQQMIERYGEQSLVELTDRTAPYSEDIVDAVLDVAIADAAALVDSFVSGRYDLPLVAVPSILRGYTGDIAFYKLHRGMYSDEVRKSYEDALDFLKRLADGKVFLDVAGSQPKSSPADARVEGPPRIFSKDSLEGF